MYVSYDPDAGATYVEWEAGTLSRTVEIGDLMMVDVDENDRPLGVEFLVLPSNVTPQMIDQLADRFPDLKKLRDVDHWAHQPVSA